MNELIYWTGVSTLVIGAASSLLVFLMLVTAIANALGRRLWNILLAHHDLRTLRAHLLQLEAEGKLKRETNKPQ